MTTTPLNYQVAIEYEPVDGLLFRLFGIGLQGDKVVQAEALVMIYEAMHGTKGRMFQYLLCFKSDEEVM